MKPKSKPSTPAPRISLFVAMVLGVSIVPVSAEKLAGKSADWHQGHASTPSMQAYIFSYFPLARTDSDGNKLNGANKYKITFEAGKIPDVKYFWTLTTYDTTINLLKNPNHRWEINSKIGGYKMAADGSLTLYVQNKSPGKNNESNWLTAPKGDFWLAFRTYGPSKGIVAGPWAMPDLNKVN